MAQCESSVGARVKKPESIRLASPAALLVGLALFSLLPPVTDSAFAAGWEDVNLAIRLREYESAARLLKLMAESGDVEAQYQLAAMYRTGRGVEQSYERATELYISAAEAGHAKAQYNLAVMYEHGLGIDLSEDEARYWFEQAARQGHEGARKRLDPSAEMDTHRDATEPGEIESFLRAAAQQGDLKKVRELLQEAIAVDAVDKFGRTALMEAAALGHEGVVQVLLSASADPAIHDYYGDNSLLLAARNRAP